MAEASFGGWRVVGAALRGIASATLGWPYLRGLWWLLVWSRPVQRGLSSPHLKVGFDGWLMLLLGLLMPFVFLEKVVEADRPAELAKALVIFPLIAGGNYLAWRCAWQRAHSDHEVIRIVRRARRRVDRMLARLPPEAPESDVAALTRLRNKWRAQPWDGGGEIRGCIEPMRNCHANEAEIGWFERAARDASSARWLVGAPERDSGGGCGGGC